MNRIFEQNNSISKPYFLLFQYIFDDRTLDPFGWQDKYRNHLLIMLMMAEHKP